MAASAAVAEDALAAAQVSAKEAEEQALAALDTEVQTPAWRETGLPMKPSMLALEPDVLKEGALLDPKKVVGGYEELVEAEVLSPLKTFVYSDGLEPGYLQRTHSVMVSTALLLPRLEMHCKSCFAAHMHVAILPVLVCSCYGG